MNAVTKEKARDHEWQILLPMSHFLKSDIVIMRNEYKNIPWGRFWGYKLRSWAVYTENNVKNEWICLPF